MHSANFRSAFPVWAMGVGARVYMAIGLAHTHTVRADRVINLRRDPKVVSLSDMYKSISNTTSSELMWKRNHMDVKSKQFFTISHGTAKRAICFIVHMRNVITHALAIKRLFASMESDAQESSNNDEPNETITKSVNLLDSKFYPKSDVETCGHEYRENNNARCVRKSYPFACCSVLNKDK